MQKVIPFIAMLATSAAADLLTYPPARRDPLVEKLHGVDVADPYRWMEDIDSGETRKWVEAQAKLADDYLNAIPLRAKLLSRLRTLAEYDKHGVPQLTAGRLFYSRRTGLQNQGILYWKEDKPGAEEKVLIDPNTLSKDGTVALSGFDISDDGKRIAYALSEAGSDWEVWRVRDVDTSTDLSDEIRWVKFSGASWSRDGKGFYYGRYEAPPKGQELKAENIDQKVYFHTVGETQEKDRLVYARPDHPRWGLGAGETEDGRYLIISVSEGTKPENCLFYRDLQKGADAPVVELLRDFEADWNFLGNEGPVFYFLTTKGAPNRRVVSMDISKPEVLKDLIPESPQVISSASMAGGRFLIQRLVDAHDDVTAYDLNGKQTGKVDLPNFGSAGGFGGRMKDRETFFGVTGFDTPGTVYRYDIAAGTRQEWVRSTVPGFDAASVTVEQVFYPSKDGTRVPMFLFSKKGLKRDGANPVILYGYGGFNIELTPAFSAARLAWLELGGVYAQAGLRGGGEYGQAWHEAGMKSKKQNVFDDFISAAEFLVKEKWTRPDRLAISGGSNGGLLVGACLLQRPDLFGCCLPAVGVHDMLRFHKFTIGWAWQEEYGSPDKAEDFPTLLRYSPVHNVKPGTAYPATMVLTGDHDDRVFPAHSFKFAAALQQAQKGTAPILLRVDLRAGHGAGKPTAKMLEEAADMYSFTARALKLE